jgi:hypothetical protein
MNHPDGIARGGTVIIVNNCIKYNQENYTNQDFLQASSVSVHGSVGLLTISAVYLPPRHTVKPNQFDDFYNTLGRRFIADGTTMQTILTGEPGLLHSKDANYSK